MDRAGTDAVRKHRALFDQLERAGIELVVVTGPDDPMAKGAYWLGAVLSVSGRTKGVPTLSEAIRDGLFAEGSDRRLIPWDPQKVTAQRMAEAKARTQHAWATMSAHGQAGQVATTTTYHPKTAADIAADRAMTYARNTRLKFERVYAAAQKAVQSGDRATALLKCRAALDLLRAEDLYGDGQKDLIEALEKEIALFEARGREQ